METYAELERVVVYMPTVAKPDRQPTFARGMVVKMNSGRMRTQLGYYMVRLDRMIGFDSALYVMAHPNEMRHE